MLILVRALFEVPVVKDFLEGPPSLEEGDSWDAVSWGRTCFGGESMPYTKWCRIYVTTERRQGEVNLMIYELRANSGQWACVKPNGEVQQINVRNRMRVSGRPKDGVDYQEVPGFSQAQLDRFDRTAQDWVRRAGGRVEAEAAARPPRRRRRSFRGSVWAADWLWTACSSAALFFYGRRGLAMTSAGGFVLWRGCRFFRVYELASWAFGTMRDTVTFVEDTSEQISIVIEK